MCVTGVGSQLHPWEIQLQVTPCQRLTLHATSLNSKEELRANIGVALSIMERENASPNPHFYFLKNLLAVLGRWLGG